MKNKKLKFSLFLVLVPLITGCDFYYGVNRKAQIEMTPIFSCVHTSIEEINEIEKVDYRIDSGGRPLTLTGLKKADEIHVFEYTTDGITGNLYFIVNYKDEVNFLQWYGFVNYKPPQIHIDKIRPIMVEIEKFLEKDCGVKNLASIVEERCVKVKCN